MYSSLAGSFWNDRRLDPIKSMIPPEKWADFDKLLGRIQAMRLYMNNVNTFINQKLDKMTHVDMRNNRTGTLSLGIIFPGAAVRQSLGSRWQVCATWVDNVKGLFDLFIEDNVPPTDIRRAKDDIRNGSKAVLGALGDSIAEIQEKANAIYTSSQRVADEAAARNSNELLVAINKAKTTTSKENIISVLNLVKKQAPNGLGDVADMVVAAIRPISDDFLLNRDAPQNSSGVDTIAQTMRPKPDTSAAAPPASLTRSMKPADKNSGNQRKKSQSVKKYKPKVTPV